MHSNIIKVRTLCLAYFIENYTGRLLGSRRAVLDATFSNALISTMLAGQGT